MEVMFLLFYDHWRQATQSAITWHYYPKNRNSGRRGGLMVSALDFGSSGPGSRPSRGHCLVFIHFTLTSLSQFLSPPRCIMGAGEFNAGCNPAMDYHPIQGGVEIFLVASCCRNRDKLQPDGPLGSCADLPLPNIPLRIYALQPYITWLSVTLFVLDVIMVWSATRWNHRRLLQEANSQPATCYMFIAHPSNDLKISYHIQIPCWFGYVFII